MNIEVNDSWNFLLCVVFKFQNTFQMYNVACTKKPWKVNTQGSGLVYIKIAILYYVVCAQHEMYNISREPLVKLNTKFCFTLLRTHIYLLIFLLNMINECLNSIKGIYIFHLLCLSFWVNFLQLKEKYFCVLTQPTIWHLST